MTEQEVVKDIRNRLVATFKKLPKKITKQPNAALLMYNGALYFIYNLCRVGKIPLEQVKMHLDAIWATERNK